MILYVWPCVAMMLSMISHALTPDLLRYLDSDTHLYLNELQQYNV